MEAFEEIEALKAKMTPEQRAEFNALAQRQLAPILAEDKLTAATARLETARARRQKAKADLARETAVIEARYHEQLQTALQVWREQLEEAEAELATAETEFATAEGALAAACPAEGEPCPMS
jgi:hypothetical protein